MAIVVKWAEDGDYLRSLYWERGVPCAKWCKRQIMAHRFVSREDAKALIRHHFGANAWAPHRLRFVRLIPRTRHASPQP